MPEMYPQDLTAKNRTNIRFSRRDLDLTNLPGLDKAVDWAASVLAEVQEELEYPTAMVVHQGLRDTVANYKVEKASRTSMFTVFKSEAARLGRS